MEIHINHVSGETVCHPSFQIWNRPLDHTNQPDVPDVSLYHSLDTCFV